MAMVTWYLTTTVVTANALWRLEEPVPAGGTNSATVCTLAKTAATNKFLFKPGQTNAVALGTTYPAGIQTQGWVSQNSYNLSWGATNWTVTHRITTGITNGGAVGTNAARMWRCTKQDLSGTNNTITPVGAGNNWNETASITLNVAVQTVTQTIAMGAGSLTAEFIYIEFIWNITTASSKTAQDVDITIQDSAARFRIDTGLVTFIQGTTDSVTVTETVARVATFLRSKSDSVALSDAVATAITKQILVSVSDSVTISETVAKLVTFVRSLSDSVTLTETVARAQLLSRGLTDTIVLSESVTVSAPVGRSTSDSITITESVVVVPPGGGPVAVAIFEYPHGAI